MPASSLFFDAAAVRRACAQASTAKAAIEALGQRPHAGSYRRLREACERYDVELPTPTRPTPRTVRVRVSVFEDDDAVRAAVSAGRSRAHALQLLGLSAATKHYERLDQACARLGLTAPAKVHAGNRTPARTGAGDQQRAALAALSAAAARSLSEQHTSLSAMLSALGLARTSHNVDLLRARFSELGLTVPDGRQRRRRHNEDLFVVGYVNPQTLKARIIADDLLEWDRCSLCSGTNFWNGRPLVLELDHISGDPRDNRLSNLRFVCPNCHSQTATFRGKNLRGRHQVTGC